MVLRGHCFSQWCCGVSGFGFRVWGLGLRVWEEFACGCGCGHLGFLSFEGCTRFCFFLCRVSKPETLHLGFLPRPHGSFFLGNFDLFEPES